MINSQH